MQALFAQDLVEEYEVLWVDDSSTDGSAEVAAQYSVRLLRAPGGCSYRARNLGVSQSVGEYLAFLDADCRPRSDWLSTLREELSRPGSRVVLGSRWSPAGCGLLQTIDRYEDALCKEVFESDRTSCYFAYTNNMAMPRSVFEEAGRFPEVVRGGDTSWLQSYLSTHDCGTVKYVPGAAVVHLEADSLGHLLKKRFLYGRSSAGLVPGVGPIPASMRNRAVQTFLPSEAWRLKVLLRLCDAFWLAGRAWGNLERTSWNKIPRTPPR